MLTRLLRVCLRYWWVIVLLLVVLFYAAVRDRTSLRRLTGTVRVRQQTVGPATADLGSATLELRADERLVAELPNENGPEGPRIAWLVVTSSGLPPTTDAAPRQEFRLAYAGSGYVPSSPLEPDSLLLSIKAGGAWPRAEDRQIAATPVLGWAVSPRRVGDGLIWGFQGPEERTILNLRLLGRQGFFSTTLYASTPTLAPAVASLEDLAGRLRFKPGYRYADYRLGEPRAPFDMDGLVLGKNPPPDPLLFTKRGMGSFLGWVSGLCVLAALWFYARALGVALASPAVPVGPEPAFKHYFFGKWWSDYRLTLSLVLQRFLLLRRGEAGMRVIWRWVVGAGENVAPAVLWLFCLVLVPGLVISFLLFVGFGVLHFALAGLLCLGSLAIAALFWSLERLLMAWRSVRLVCSNRGCYRKIALPMYLCPGCGALHRRLMPGSYGTWQRRCQCGQSLPTSFLNGRNRLQSLCPHCERPLAVVLAPSLHFPVVGTVGAGKTTFLAALVLELDPELPAPRDRVWRERARLGQLEKTVGFDPDAFVMVIDGRVVHVYDAAGEAFEDIGSLRRHGYMAYTSGLFLLVDASGAQEVYDRVARCLRELGSLCPLAIVVTRRAGVDARQWMLENGYGNLVRDAEASFPRVGFFAVDSLTREGVEAPLRFLLSAPSG